MSTIRCTARVRKDGTLSISRTDREVLGLEAGDLVEVVLRNPVPQIDPADNPLLKIIGIAGKGGKPDGAENHDKYLYGKKTP